MHTTGLNSTYSCWLVDGLPWELEFARLEMSETTNLKKIKIKIKTNKQSNQLLVKSTNDNALKNNQNSQKNKLMTQDREPFKVSTTLAFYDCGIILIICWQ